MHVLILKRINKHTRYFEIYIISMCQHYRYGNGFEMKYSNCYILITKKKAFVVSKIVLN